MSRKSDRSQGMVKDTQPRAHKVPQPDGAAIIRGIGRAVNAKDKAETKPRPAQHISDPQDWRRG